jgi:hypothetical protein
MNILLKKDVEFKWNNDGKKSFEHIKDAIVVALVLVSLDYTKYFIIYSFASKDTIVGILLQKNDQGNEQPISFMRKVLRDAELNYKMT